MLITLTLAPLSALGLRWLLRRANARWHPAALVGVAGLLLVEFVPMPWPTQPSAVHPYTQVLRQGQGAILDLPPAVYKKIQPQQAQLVHGRAIFGGYLARAPIYPLVDEAAVLRDLWAAGLGASTDPGQALIAPTDPLAVLRSYGVRNVVVHWNQIAPTFHADVQAAIARALPGVRPTFADADLSDYLVPAGPPQPVAYFGVDWYAQERDGARSWRWMGESATIIAFNPTPAAMALRLEVRGESFQAARDLSIELDGARIGGWPFQPWATAANLRLLVPPGTHRLTLRARTSTDSVSRRALSIVLYTASGSWQAIK